MAEGWPCLSVGLDLRQGVWIETANRGESLIRDKTPEDISWLEGAGHKGWH